MVVRSCWHCLVGPAPRGFPQIGTAPTRRRWEWRWSRNGRWQDGHRATSRDSVAGAGGDDEEPPRAVPGVGVGEAGRADLGAVGGCPAAGGDLPVGVPVVGSRPVRSRAVPSYAASVVAATYPGRRGQGREVGDRARGGGEGEVARADPVAPDEGEELGGGQAVGVGEVLEPGLDRLTRAWGDADRQECAHAGFLARVKGSRVR
jgi:hypothetical protein